MGSDTEYKYQRKDAAYWIGYCDAAGIELVLPKNTMLLSHKIYGYEGGSMIFRQDLERVLGDRREQKKNAYARLANFEGQMAQYLRDHSEEEAQTDPQYAKIQQGWDVQYQYCLIYDGAVQTLEKLLQEIDLEEPDPELLNFMGRVDMPKSET